MNKDKSIEIAERELGRKKEIKRDDSFDRADYDAPIEVEAYTEGFNEMRDKAIPLLADKIMEIDAWKKGADIKSDGGSDRECGHFVKDILSFCPVCRKIAELQQKLDDVEAERDVIKFINKKTEQKLDRVLGLDIEAICNEFDIWGADEEGLIKSLKQKIQEAVGG